ncbi:hypothetical protein [Streptosporangium sp. NPDC050284]|uniref:hypothetical protein n=1 Tax=Streptosporangium sp. NPDC050284 TaxID=3366193 RepID=UPI00378F7B4F
MNGTGVHYEYFAWQPVEHRPGCARGWVVRQQGEESPDGTTRQAAVQLVCPLPDGCGKVVEFEFDNEPTTTPSGGPGDRWKWHTMTVDQVGYGSSPLPVAGVWLHPGGPLLRYWNNGEGPAYYVVTESAERPSDWSQVLGVIGQARTRGRQLASRWYAHANYQPLSAAWHRYQPRDTTDRLKSQAAAVRWVLAAVSRG